MRQKPFREDRLHWRTIVTVSARDGPRVIYFTFFVFVLLIVKCLTTTSEIRPHLTHNRSVVSAICSVIKGFVFAEKPHTVILRGVCNFGTGIHT